MNWSEGANYYLLKYAKNYHKDWKHVSSVLRATINIYRKEERDLDYSPKNCSIQYKYLIASTRQSEGQSELLKEDDLLQIALEVHRKRYDDKLAQKFTQEQTALENEQRENELLLSGKFSELPPASIELFRKRLRAMQAPDVIGQALNLEPLPLNPDEDKEVLRKINEDKLKSAGLGQSVYDPDTGLWIPVEDEHEARHFFESKNNDLLQSYLNVYEKKSDVKPRACLISIPSSPHQKISKAEIQQALSIETSTAAGSGSRRACTAASKKAQFNNPRRRSPSPNTPWSIGEDSEGSASTPPTRSAIQKRHPVSALKVESSSPSLPLRTPTRSRSRSNHTADSASASSSTCQSPQPHGSGGSTGGASTGGPRRRWRRGLQGVVTAASIHRHGQVFLLPVTDEIAPHYSSMIRSPMDITTLRRRLDSAFAAVPAPAGGRSTAAAVAEAENSPEVKRAVERCAKQLLRDFLLMFANARMYNNREHDVHHMAGEMCADVLAEIRQLWTQWSEEIPGLSVMPGIPTTANLPQTGVAPTLRRRGAGASVPPPATSTAALGRDIRPPSSPPHGTC